MADIPDEIELITQRLRLRCYQEQDTEAFYKLIQQNKVRLAPAFPSRVLATKHHDEALKIIKRFRVDWMLGQVYAFGIWLQSQNSYIGEITLKNFDHSVPKAEIAYYLDAPAEGKGLGEEALKSILQFAFEKLEVNKLYIRCSLQNSRSYDLAERCGFKREGTIRQDFRDHTRKLIDIYYYGLTRSDFEKLEYSR